MRTTFPSRRFESPEIRSMASVVVLLPFDTTLSPIAMLPVVHRLQEILPHLRQPSRLDPSCLSLKTLLFVSRGGGRVPVRVPPFVVSPLVGRSASTSPPKSSCWGAGFSQLVLLSPFLNRRSIHLVRSEVRFDVAEWGICAVAVNIPGVACCPLP